MVDMRYDAEISDVFFLGRQFIDPFVGLLVKLGHKGLCGGFADPHIAEALTRYLSQRFICSGVSEHLPVSFFSFIASVIIL